MGRVEVLVTSGDERGDRVATVQRHEGVAQRVVGRVQRERQVDLPVQGGELFDARDDADGRDRHAAGAEADLVDDAQRRLLDVAEVGERLAHPHEDDVVEASAGIEGRAPASATCSTISPALR